MGVWTYFYRLDAEALRQYRKNRGNFNLEQFPGCESIDIDKTSDALAWLISECRPKDRSIRGFYDFLQGVGGIEEKKLDMRRLNAKQVARISQILDTISIDDVRRAYDPAAMKEEGVFLVSDEIWDEDRERVLGYLLPNFTKLVEFFRRAREAEQHVVIGFC